MRASNRPLRALLPGLLCLALLASAGCANAPRRLMPTPASFKAPAAAAIFDAVPAARRKPEIDLFFITNRAPEDRQASGRPYGEGRSRSLAFGSAVVRLVPALSWSELTRQSLTDKRSREINLELGAVREQGRFPNEPYPVVPTATGLQRDPATLRIHQETRAQFQAEVQRRLQTAPSGDVMLYVHGFNETFASAAFTTAELCHFFGRDQVCAFFTWPASASGNILTSFASTTESGQFSVGHLKRTIRALAQTPGVEGVQLVAHSRGAAVLLSALRELYIQAIAAGLEPAEVFKIKQVVLVSADIDAEVASQQVVIFASDPDLLSQWSSPDLPEMLRGRLSVYSSPNDRALSLSRILFRSGSRIGQIAPSNTHPEVQDLFRQMGNVDLIVYEGRRTDFFGHSFFTSNPRVSADLVELIRNGSSPDNPARGLVRNGPIAWSFPNATPAGRR